MQSPPIVDLPNQLIYLAPYSQKIFWKYTPTCIQYIFDDDAIKAYFANKWNLIDIVPKRERKPANWSKCDNFQITWYYIQIVILAQSIIFMLYKIIWKILVDLKNTIRYVSIPLEKL